MVEKASIEMLKLLYTVYMIGSDHNLQFTKCHFLLDIIIETGWKETYSLW